MILLQFSQNTDGILYQVENLNKSKFHKRNVLYSQIALAKFRFENPRWRKSEMASSEIMLDKIMRRTPHIEVATYSQWYILNIYAASE